MSTEAEVITQLRALVQMHWHDNGKPLFLGPAGQALMSNSPNYRQVLAGRTLGDFVRATEADGNYRLIAAGTNGHPGIVPDGAQYPPEPPKLGMRAPLGLKRTAESGKVRQSFSHGRSNTVIVEVKRRRILGDPVTDRAPQAIDGVPSAFGYGWSKQNTIVLQSSSINVPRLPFPSSQRDHANRLQACRTLATDLADQLDRAEFNVRVTYKDELRRYASRLPGDPNEENILLADAAARTIRALFEAEANILSPAFAASLKILLEQHMGLRPFYPDLEVFYRDVRSGRLQAPLPLDAVDGVVQTVQEYTPEIFDPSVESAIDDSATATTLPVIIESEPAEEHAPIPPPDPFGDLDPSKARDFQVAGVVNRLWQVFLKGETIHKSSGAWRSTYEALEPYVAQILHWLAQFVGR